VVRNRAKRLLREAVRRHWDATPDSCDCVLHVRTRMREASYADVEAELLRTMRRARAKLGVE
jgi:ribonuclease P protein component